MKLSDLAKHLNAELCGSSDVDIHGVSGLSDADSGDISFLANQKYQHLLQTTKASAVLVPNNFNYEVGCTLLKVDDPDKVFAQAALLFYQKPSEPKNGIHASAVIASDVTLGKNISIGPNCVIEEKVVIGDNVILGPNVVIGYGSLIGSDVRLFPSVTLREYCIIGNRVIIHNGSVVGSDGFGYILEKDETRTKIPQIGHVVIGDDVEIGANVTIDRARFGKTVIGRGTKIDNLVQIAHNVQIGEDSILCGQVGIAGSANIGSKTILAGQVGVCGHLSVGDKVIANAKTGITKDIPSGEHIMGMPGVKHTKYNKAYAEMLQLSKLREKVRYLEKIIHKLTS